MPVLMQIELRRLTQDEFKEAAYEVLGVTFRIHNEYGRFFNEKIYQRELHRRMEGILVEVPVDVVFHPFEKRYFLDVVAVQGAVFEYKAVEALVERHASQLLNYLMLTDLPRGMLINVRPERVQHRFVNSNLRLADRTQFTSLP